MTTNPEPAPRVGRRQLLQTGGLTLTLGALIAACGESAEGEPGRVGYAPAATPLPTVEKNDVVYLRTATSIEQTLVDHYATITETGALDADTQALVDRLVEDHTAAAATAADHTVAAGGEPYECANTWYQERVIAPILTQIEGDEAQGIAPSDDPARDYLALVNAMESMAGAMYQQMTELVTQPERRGDLMELGAQAARHSAAVAIRATGAPDGYVSPDLLGEEVTPDETGLTPLYAIPTQFGSLAAAPLTIGAPGEGGTRFDTAIETPAANSYIYEGMTCEV